VKIARPLVDSLRDRHVIEAIGPFAFYGALASARFDRVSHILPTYQIAGSCQQYAEQPVDGCNGHFAAFGKSGGNGGSAKRSRTEAKAAAPRGGRAAHTGRHRRRRHGGQPGRGLSIPERAAHAVNGAPSAGGDMSASDLLDWLLQP
jgi:hypothetical protein